MPEAGPDLSNLTNIEANQENSITPISQQLVDLNNKKRNTAKTKW